MADTKMARLTQQQFFGLCRAVQANAERYQADRPNFTSVARELAGTLGMAINDVQVKRAAETVGCLWEPTKVSRGPEPSRVREQVKGLVERVEKLEGDSSMCLCKTLEGRVETLGNVQIRQAKFNEEIEKVFNQHVAKLTAELAALRGVVVTVCEEFRIPLPPGMVPSSGKLPFSAASK